MRKPRAACVNGCDAPPYMPLSKVLCQACFAKLSAKFYDLGRRLSMDPPAPRSAP